jgi:hypothetical protein
VYHAYDKHILSPYTVFTNWSFKWLQALLWEVETIHMQYTVISIFKELRCLLVFSVPGRTYKENALKGVVIVVPSIVCLAPFVIVRLISFHSACTHMVVFYRAARAVWGDLIKEVFNVDSSRDMNDLASLLLRGGSEEADMPIKGVSYRQFLPASHMVCL